jgi:stearoyl-CoA desaturase (Delta-9 desaturase)
MKNISHFEWVSILFITFVHGGFLVGTPLYFSYYSWNWIAFFAGCLIYTVAAIGITAGYHRYFSHKTYQAHPIIENIYLLVGCLGFAGSAATWSYDHRIHHAKTDTMEDPYSIKRGFFFAHMGWFLLKRPAMDPTKIPDLWADKWVRMQHRYYHALCALFNIIIVSLIASIT